MSEREKQKNEINQIMYFQRKLKHQRTKIVNNEDGLCVCGGGLLTFFPSSTSFPEKVLSQFVDLLNHYDKQGIQMIRLR